VDQTLKSKWVAALRSGKYEQCSGSLHRDGGYCCLGVLWDISGNPWIDKDRGIAGFLDNNETFEKLFMREFGIPSKTSAKLADKNDGAAPQRRHSFAEIADYIEKSI
jgi:hypothetical protein